MTTRCGLRCEGDFELVIPHRGHERIRGAATIGVGCERTCTKSLLRGGFPVRLLDGYPSVQTRRDEPVVRRQTRGIGRCGRACGAALVDFLGENVFEARHTRNNGRALESLSALSPVGDAVSV